MSDELNLLLLIHTCRYLEGGDLSDLPELGGPPAGEYEEKGGFDDFMHSYPSSSFEKAMSVQLTVGPEEAPTEPIFPCSPLSPL